VKLAILGAPGSGKTRLARDLAQQLPASAVSDAPDPRALREGQFDRVLLMGLDLPGMGSVQLAADAQLRATLEQHGVSYAVVYGHGAQRSQAAMRLITPQEGPPPRWRGVCDKCADPDCERRLFTELTSSRADARPSS